MTDTLNTRPVVVGLTDAQLAMRRTGMSATDVVAITDEGFGNVYDTYLDKIGEGKPFDGKRIALRAGHAMEPIIVDFVAEKHDLSVQPGQTVRHKFYDWVLATPDRFVSDYPVTLDEAGCIVGPKVPHGVLEAKLVGGFRRSFWFTEDGEIVLPPGVEIQVQWQMGASAVPRAWVGSCIGAPTDESAYFDIVVDFNPDFFGDLVTIAQDFWENNVLRRVPPTVNGSDAARAMLFKRWPTVRRAQLVRATPEQEALALEFLRLGVEIGEMADKREAIGNQLREIIGDAEGIHGDTWKATHKSRLGQVSYKNAAEEYRHTLMQLGVAAKPLEAFRGDGTRALLVGPLTKKELGYMSGPAKNVREFDLLPPGGAE